MTGKARLEDQPLAIRSACTFYIYKMAIWVLNGETKEARNGRLAQVPDNIRLMVEDEAKKIWLQRKKDIAV